MAVVTPGSRIESGERHSLWLKKGRRWGNRKIKAKERKEQSFYGCLNIYIYTLFAYKVGIWVAKRLGFLN